ncbi:MAG: hypothetical protein KC593_21145 [Myxococcales bacterium]|nr:hypothetical protein [Myxococcales bacterium]MCB9626979.1 hypothetical protein [Sandaracinaceae bacterium]
MSRHARRLPAHPLGALAAFATLAASALGCGGSLAEPEDWRYTAPAPEPQPVESEPDLTTVTWPDTPTPLPSDVPWWANEFGSNRSGVFRHRPLFGGAAERLARADGALRGELAPTVLFCRVEYTGPAQDPRPAFRDSRRARADLSVVGRIGTGHEFAASGSDNTRVFSFGAPTLALRVGDTITLRFRDRDFIRHDALGTLTFHYEGALPIEAVQGPLGARCTALPPSDVNARAPGLLRAVDAAMARDMTTRVPDDGVPLVEFSRFEPSREALSRAATWLTWAHPDVQLRRARLDVLLERHEAQRRAAFAALVARLEATPAETLRSGERVAGLGISCERGSTGLTSCVGRFRVEATAGAVRYVQAHSVTEASRTVTASQVTLEADALVYEVPLTQLLPRSSVDQPAAEVVLEIAANGTGAGTLLLLRHAPRSAF